jgi:hypothetical protein
MPTPRDPEWLAEIKGRGRRGRTIVQWEGDLDRLIREVEQLADENHLLNGFAADHGHDRCLAEIRRLREELVQART